MGNLQKNDLPKRLGRSCPKNASRDWWRKVNGGPVSIPTSKLREFWRNSKAFGEPWAEEISSDEMGITALKRAAKPLTGKGLRFQVVELRGDWQFHKKVWRFHNTNWNAENVCHHCDAKGISDSWPELYWNLDNNNHRDFSLPQFLVHRMPPRRV
ncbi:unnamed protein product [Cladocopium goreaui]|uniref:Uncharacterized protein n=1 Tax=Cladocopium goreaui TaxID=2562237 RepID=A0A9P1CHA4_9DINO|nr:unnamed protein product [Cladocopium goreaui]